MTQPLEEQLLRTSAEWLPLLFPGYAIEDHDGWRTADAPDFNRDPISEEEFQNRFNRSTIKFPKRNQP